MDISHWVEMDAPGKGFDWDAMGRLHENGMIDNPVGKAKSVYLTKEGIARSERLFHEMFSKSD